MLDVGQKNTKSKRLMEPFDQYGINIKTISFDKYSSMQRICLMLESFSYCFWKMKSIDSLPGLIPYLPELCHPSICLLQATEL
jgi:hypothetical protein